MSFLRALRRPPLANVCCRSHRFYANESKPDETSAVKEENPGSTPVPTQEAGTTNLSSCPEGSILEGVSYLKGQPPILALADDKYPSWLWTILEPKVIPDDGPGGKAEKVRLRRENRQRIRDQNFMKTQ